MPDNPVEILPVENPPAETPPPEKPPVQSPPPAQRPGEPVDDPRVRLFQLADRLRGVRCRQTLFEYLRLRRGVQNV
jgi:hypothetical protein